MWSEQIRAARALLRAANGLGSRGAEAVWTRWCALAGRLPRPHVRRWASSGRERVLVIAAHADDEAAGCAGTLIRHRSVGDSVRVTVVTDGSRSSALGLDPTSMRAWREGEARQAAALIRAQCDWVGLVEDGWSDAEARFALHRSLADFDPTVVYAPSLIDFQPEHRGVARVLASTLVQSRLRPEVRIHAVQVPLAPMLAYLVHDVPDLQEPIRSAIAAYATQRESVFRTLRMRRYAARYFGGSSQVESFCSMSAGLYASLQMEAPAQLGACMHVPGVIL
jgi:LmbE family N-acetylglucosaminyl deacetylase